MGNNIDGADVKIFISHKTEDKRLAEKIRDKLMILSKGQLKPNLCYEIPGGKKYQNVIEDSLRNSDILVFLYTSKEADLRWCLYEAGVFVGSDKFEKKHLLCIKGQGIEEPPVTLKNLQAYTADEEGIKNLFKDLLSKDIFTNKIINDKLFIEYETEYKQAIAEVEREFSTSVISTDYFYRRASIKFPKNIEDKDVIQLDKAIVTGNEYTMQILGVSKESSWNNLYELYLGSGDVKWLDEIKDCVQKICRQVRPTRPLTPFRSVTNNSYYTPMVSRVERIKDNPIRISIIFIDTHHIMEQDKNPKVPLSRMPADQKGITQIISMALTLRWGILEEYIDYFERADDQELKVHCKELDQALSEMEKEGADFKMIAVVLSLFPVADHSILKKAINKYLDARDLISQAVDNPNRDEIIGAINDMRWSNKVFLKKATNVCYKNIDKLEPIEIDENT